MRAVVQRVAQARVRVNGQVTGEIGPGIVALLGVARVDTQASAAQLAEKIAGLRLFNDAEGKMNLSLEEVGGAVLAISQFPLYGDTRQGRRPSFDRAAPAEQARALYEAFVAALRALGLRVETGVFQAMMEVELTNAGPVTLLVDTEKEYY